jgi:hypothetical protein
MAVTTLLVPACSHKYFSPTSAQKQYPITPSAAVIPTIDVSEQPSSVATDVGPSPEIATATEISATDFSLEMIEKINLENALKEIKQLTGEEPVCLQGTCYTINSRETGSVGLGWAKSYVYSELVDFGYSVEYHEWSRGGYSDQNIIARKPGLIHPDEQIYFVAHLDGVGSSLFSKRPAANDNASGVVDLLQLAQIISNYSFSRTLVLLFSTGEEQGTLGVDSYLAQLSPEEISAIKYVVNVDSVGYDANQDHVMELWYGDHSPSFDLVTRMSEMIDDYQLNLSSVLVVGCG